MLSVFSTQLDFLYELVNIHYFVGVRVEVSPSWQPNKWALLYYLFAMIDLTKGMFSDEKFASSILGCRLKVWSMLPDSAMIHGLWHRAPLQATYYWFAPLQLLLEIENKWIKTLRFHPEQGFSMPETGMVYAYFYWIINCHPIFQIGWIS
jgi:hypothetical protein